MQCRKNSGSRFTDAVWKERWQAKKTAQSGVRAPIPAGAADAYEGLRQQVVQPDGRGEHLEGRSVLIRCGFATWSQISPAAMPQPPPASLFACGSELAVLDSFQAEVVHLVASLILSTRKEDPLPV